MPRTVDEYRKALTLIRNVADAVLLEPTTTPPPDPPKPPTKPPREEEPDVDDPPRDPEEEPKPPVPPPTPPSPPPSGGGSLPRLTTGKVWGSDFTEYTSGTDFAQRVSQVYGDGVNKHLAVLDDGVKYDGHRTLRYDMPAGTKNVPELVRMLGRGYDDLWWRGVIRFSPGWNLDGQSPADAPNSGKSYKISDGLWQRHYERVHCHYAGSEYQIGAIANETTGKNVLAPTYVKCGGVATEWGDGRWYQYILHCDLRTQPGKAVTRFWFGLAGATPALRGTETKAVTPGAAGPPLLHAVSFGKNFNLIRSRAQSVWYGLQEVADGSKGAPFGVA